MEVEHFRRGFQDVFLPALETALNSPADFAEARGAITMHADRIIERYRHDWPSNRDPYNLEFTAFMLGTWHTLRASRTDTEIGQLLETTLDAGLGWLTDKVRQVLDDSPDAFEALVATSREREVSFFGDGFTFHRAVESAVAYHIEVTRCWFIEVCRAEGAMGIAPAFCAFDAIWFTAIDAARHGARFERPTVIADGGDRCRFNIDRI